MNLTNFQDHPTDDRYLVYSVRIQEQADYFEGLLKEKGIEYEKHGEDGVIYFATGKRHTSVTHHLNNLAIGKYRKPFIADRTIRLALVTVSLLLIALAITGYVMSR